MDLRRLVVEKNQQQQKHRYTIAKGIRTSWRATMMWALLSFVSLKVESISLLIIRRYSTWYDNHTKFGELNDVVLLSKR